VVERVVARFKAKDCYLVVKVARGIGNLEGRPQRKLERLDGRDPSGPHLRPVRPAKAASAPEDANGHRADPARLRDIPEFVVSIRGSVVEGKECLADVVLEDDQIGGLEVNDGPALIILDDNFDQDHPPRLGRLGRARCLLRNGGSGGGSRAQRAEAHEERKDTQA
jgi:hypothetical protein